MTRVVVVGDVHGNARALRAALATARSEAFDRLVFLGDLLTYGSDIDEVVDLVHEAQQLDHATLILGNHDQMYQQLLVGDRSYFDSLPTWIQDSAAYTLGRLDGATFCDVLQWSEETTIDGVLLGHANPFGDWSYVSASTDHVRTAKTLERRRLRGGVFGHTHRARWYVGNPEQATSDVELSVPQHCTAPATLVANAGAIGQPRDRGRTAVILRLSIRPDEIAGTFVPIDYDVTGHVNALRQLPLPSQTVDRLCAFFTQR